MRYKTFKGTESEYRRLHYWVAKNLGKPKECVGCGDTTAKIYTWANDSGEYRKDLSDWLRLCVPCHRAKDGVDHLKGQPRKKKEYCKRGHKIEEGNVWVKPSTGYQECLTCKRMYHKKDWIEKRKLVTQ